MKKFLVFLCAMSFIFGMATSAIAYPYLDEILPGYPEHIMPSGADYVYLTDLTEPSTSIATLLFEGASYESAFGIYSIYEGQTIDDIYNNDQFLLLFLPWDEPSTNPFLPTQTEVLFDLEQGTAEVNTSSNPDLLGMEGNINASNFGFFIAVWDTGDVFATEASLNSDGAEHGLIYDIAQGAVIVAFEDLPSPWTGTEPDYNDMVVKITDVSPVHEPATMLLLGSGLIGLGVFGRKKLFKKQSLIWLFTPLDTILSNGVKVFCSN